jgi:Predicted transcriptional regulators
MSLTNKLVELMNERGINRSELAKGAGIPYTTIVALFEKGSENTKLSTLKKLTTYFGVSLDTLAGEPEEMSRTDPAHREKEEWTEEEIEEIKLFKEFLMQKRKKQE